MSRWISANRIVSNASATVLRTIARLAVLLVMTASLSAQASARDRLQRGRELYASAAFEEALAMLEGAESSDPSVRVAVYQCRALSLLALRRDSEAQQEIAAMIAIDPTAPTALGAVPPRFRAMVLAVWLPRLRVIVQQHYAQGKTFFRAGAWQEAAGAFHVVLNLLDYADAGARSDRVLADLRELASEYLALAQDRAGSQDAVPDNPGH